MFARWPEILALAIGGAIGANLRHWLGVTLTDRFGTLFPWATLTINLTGALAIGFLVSLFLRQTPDPRLRLLVVSGILGGYTTFSTYAYEAYAIYERGEPFRAMVYLFGSAIAGVFCVIIGVTIARLAFGPIR